ncbi:DUF4112 domain-containing protein [Alteraurantiacibacter aquimixticola]|uniref:DUF4112 domain-containing protein n=1 Tax=Alteraurantiacibacter aquimixticola TaxID=2489173 RepID=A0A4T3F0G8_9SPHN|nr:DUF4112 domain-containing protein [Alteraurantiacibacter aquimixticola]TIX49407.1 DUF4112 domain-containing protein [Alteraurantiacibacter aquimixticola]
MAEPQRPRPFTPELPLGKEPAAIRQRVEAMEAILERSFIIPGINRPVGLDALAGLIPVVGDVVTAAMGAYIVWEARNLGLPKWKIARMAGNVLFDSAVGAVPVAGDLFDFLFRSNSRNLKIIRKHLDKHHPADRVIEG